MARHPSQTPRTGWMRLAGLIAIGAAACGESPQADRQSAERGGTPLGASERRAGPPEGMVLIPGGTFLMGSERSFPHEAPVHEVELDGFYMDSHEVTNDEFAEFVAAAGYVSEAELWGWSIAFLPDSELEIRVPNAEWWAKVDEADWRHPMGPESSIEAKGDYPVVQVSWNDAAAFCSWRGKRLPSEAEWEYAQRGGLENKEYPWGDELAPPQRSMANYWQGFFPREDKGLDGFVSLSPVGRFPPNGYGLYDISGNVWEWCADWYDPAYYARSPRRNPRGPAAGAERILRGGSFLCAENYCQGYRNAHRNKNAPDTGLDHTGFRCVISVADWEPAGE